MAIFVIWRSNRKRGSMNSIRNPGYFDEFIKNNNMLPAKDQEGL
jgi:hypothetical protein